MANLAEQRLVISVPEPEGENMSEDKLQEGTPVPPDADGEEALVAPEPANDQGTDVHLEERPEELRHLEALLFAASEPVDEKVLGERLPDGVDVHAALRRLQMEYAPRGVNLVRIERKWTFRTANDLSWLLTREAVEPKKLSRAAVETLAIIAYHQPVTRAEIEEIRGVAAAKGTLDVLLETGWIKPRGRRKAPGRPLTYGTTEGFLSHFGLETLADLPGLEELKGSGLLDGRIPAGFSVPVPSDDPALRDDEDPLEPGDLDLVLAPRVEDEEPVETPATAETDENAESVDTGEATVEADEPSEAPETAEPDKTGEPEQE
ncbi:SMC-Scp complex subunit ScpB [Xanthobacteraceae bacterium Astr-EGSB]|uniref:SMC-Scp complex subunit ScpB n=1 Tax=Astrobacterium formosum TaxID=3069710 RepID=UPI0027AEBB56|nr:SMC-Scp complex subunit ScpB [Xanthobacteraceae bacterium Astr-EGSB]